MAKEKSVLAVDYKNGIIWLDGVITPKTAYNFERAIRKFKKSDVSEITFYIRGPGGDVFSTLYMMELIKNSGLRIGCVAHDYANSGCLMLTQAGLWIAALPKTKFLFHQTNHVFYNGSQFNSSDLTEAAQCLQFLDGIQLKWLFSKGRQLERIYYLFRSEAVVTVPQAIKLGLVDCYFKKDDFLKDRNRIRKILRSKTKKVRT